MEDPANVSAQILGDRYTQAPRKDPAQMPGNLSRETASNIDNKGPPADLPPRSENFILHDAPRAHQGEAPNQPDDHSGDFTPEIRRSESPVGSPLDTEKMKAITPQQAEIIKLEAILSRPISTDLVPQHIQDEAAAEMRAALIAPPFPFPPLKGPPSAGPPDGRQKNKRKRGPNRTQPNQQEGNKHPKGGYKKLLDDYQKLQEDHRKLKEDHQQLQEDHQKLQEISKSVQGVQQSTSVQRRKSPTDLSTQNANVKRQKPNSFGKPEIGPSTLAEDFVRPLNLKGKAKRNWKYASGTSGGHGVGDMSAENMAKLNQG